MTSPSDNIGRVLGGRYRLEAVLGIGASAIVYRAEDTTLERQVAIKILQPALAQDEAFLKRFRAEARAVAALNHPAILQVYDWGEDDSVPYLVTELLAGGTLKDLFDAGVLMTPEQAVSIGGQAAAGLAYAHARGLVHRDVKPANLLFDGEGRLRITDFGVARALAEASWTEPAGSMIGTVRYASPEQAEGESVDGKADVYSLALVLYEAVTGVVPFIEDSLVATLRARVGKTLPQDDRLGPLDPILVQAAFPDRSARLDAEAFELRLASVARALPDPAPLPRVIDGAVVVDPTWTAAAEPFRPPSVDELTQVVPAITDTGPVPAGVGAASTPYDFMSDEQTLVGEIATGPGGRGRRRRRVWPWVLLALVVLGGAFAAFAIATKLFVPNVTVPKLVGKPTVNVERKLAKLDLHPAYQPSVYSITVPADHIIFQQPAPGAVLKQGATVRLVASRGLPPVTVPSLAGMDCAQAQAALTAVHLVGDCPKAAKHHSATVPKGQVIRYTVGTSTNPATATYGSTITIVISKGPPPVPIPAVTGTYAQANAALVAAGFTVVKATESSPSVPSGQITRTSPPAGTKVQRGTQVTVYVSTGPALVVVPTLAGKTAANASAKLTALGLKVGAIYGPPAGRVFKTTPRAGTSVKVGSTITLYLQ